MDASSSCSVSSSLRVWDGLKDNARRNLDFMPPLRDEVASCGGESIAARSLSSRDIRFSAVKFPCDSGDGRVKRGAGEGLEGAADVVVGEVAVVGNDGVIPDGRVVVVAVELDEDDDAVRLWRLRSGLGLGDAWAGDGELRAELEFALEAVLLRERLAGPVAGTLWPL